MRRDRQFLARLASQFSQSPARYSALSYPVQHCGLYRTEGEDSELEVQEDQIERISYEVRHQTGDLLVISVEVADTAVALMAQLSSRDLFWRQTSRPRRDK